MVSSDATSEPHSDLATAARALARRGFRVLPLRPGGKAPLIDDWPKRATTAAHIIDGWWRTWPSANVGLATGDGLLVIDVDAGGEATISDLEARLGQLPPTLTVATGGGGRHLYFTLPEGVRVGNSVRQLGRGVDVRADGGQVVAPPSVHRNGCRYGFVDDAPPAELPPAWAARLQASSPPSPAPPFRLEDGELVPEGERDTTMFRLACSLRARGLGEAAIRAAVGEENARRCRPPLVDADIDRIARSAARYTPGEATSEGRLRRLSGDPTPRPSLYVGDDVEPADPEPALPRFPVHCLPTPAAEMVAATAEAVGVPVDMVGLPVLVAMAAAIGASRSLHVRSTWTEYAVLWGAVVAPPSTGKTPTMRAVMEPLRRWQRDRFAEVDALFAAWEREVEAWEHTRPRDRGRRPQRPAIPRLIVDDFTVEKLAELFNENPRGLVADNDELAGWVRSMNQYKAGGRGSDRAKFLSMWSSEKITVDRKLSPKPLHVHRPVLSVIGGVQPGVLGELREKDDGFLERFLFVMLPDIRPPRWSDAELPDSVRNGWNLLIGRLLAEPMVATEHEPCPRPVLMSPDARIRFIEHYDAHMAATAAPGLPPHLYSLYGKFQAHAARLLLVVHCAHSAVDGREWVQPATVEDAWELALYFRDHAVAACGSSNTTEFDRRVDTLVRWIRRNNGRTTLRDIRRAGICGVKTNGEVSALIERLVARGLGRRTETAMRGGKRVEVVLF